MLTVGDLKYHCRACLVRLNACPSGQDSSESFVIAEYPQLEALINLCLGCPNAGDNDMLESYMPNLCHSCYDKWLDFAKHYQVLRENHEELRKILEKGVVDADDLIQSECVHGEEKSNEDVKWEVENYDTTSPFYNEELPEEIANSPAVNHLPDSSTPISNHNIYNLTDENCSKEDRLINGDISRNDLSNESSTEKIEEVSYESENPLKTGRRKTCMKVTKKYHVSSENGSKSTPIKKVVHRCEPCKKYFYGIHRYEGHMKQVHDGIKNAYQCKHCNKAYRFYKNLHDHIASSHSNEVNDAESFKCNDCNKVYKTKVNLQTHITNKHQNSKSIICDQCGFIGSSIYGLNRHIKNKHLVPEKIKCEHCPKVFKNQYYLKYHKLNFHNPQDIRPFKCSVCDMTFTRIALLNAHKRTHLKLSERIKCDYEGCEVRFLFNGEKTKHIRLVHLKVKQYVCDICNQAFGTAPTLRYHRYIHTGEKPFSCNCGQKFRQSSALKTHQKTHESKTENSGQIVGI